MPVKAPLFHLTSGGPVRTSESPHRPSEARPDDRFREGNPKISRSPDVPLRFGGSFAPRRKKPLVSDLESGASSTPAQADLA